jgi:hypothetical protein
VSDALVARVIARGKAGTAELGDGFGDSGNELQSSLTAELDVDHKTEQLITRTGVSSTVS